MAVIVFIAKRRFGPDAGERWRSYLAWSGLHHLHEVVTLDAILCPTVPEELVPEDWQHNVHADYRIFFFGSLDYLRRRVAGEAGLHILAAVQDPTAEAVEAGAGPGFEFVGFDLLDVSGDVSALTNCGGWDGVFAGEELSPLGLLTDLDRARAVRETLRRRYPGEHHALCDVWAVWRLVEAP
jgi:hypothetical protein